MIYSVFLLLIKSAQQQTTAIISRTFHKADKEIRASWLAPGVWPTTIAMIANGMLNLEPLVSKAVPLSEAATAIVNLRARKDDPIKVQVTP